ncbi:MAG: hypothetical protein KA479_06210 [Saprospiraceae bacterium]|nr:hypothetical protein [Saprospiraceae bacterium]
MKSTKLFLPFLTAIALIHFACEKTDIDESVITYLPKIDVIGSSDVQLACDATGYTDAGVTATEGGQSVPVNTTITGSYFGSSAVDGPDQYVINYAATNVDGIPGAAMRSILWPACNGDLVTSIAGMYKATVVRNGVVSPQYTDLQYIFIRDMGNNVYQLSDAIGGYYDFGRGIGPVTAATGFTLIANDIPSNNFTFDKIINFGAPFGAPDETIEMTAFAVDASTRTITFTTIWSIVPYTFEVTLTQVDI